MLDQEKKNLENLKSSNNANRNEITQAETNILRLQEQLRQMHGEVSVKCITSTKQFINQHNYMTKNKKTKSNSFNPYPFFFVGVNR